MSKYKQIWIAATFIIFAGLACQSQEAIPSPEAEPLTEKTTVEYVQPAAVDPQPFEVQISAAEEQDVDIVSSIESHNVLGFSVEPVPTVNPETGQSGADLLQLGTLPVASGFNPPSGCEASTDVDFEVAVLNYVNEERVRFGLSPLTSQYQLTAAAVVHTTDMACNNFFSHTGSDGSSPFTRIKLQGYAYGYAGENLFAGNGMYNDPQQAVSAWMNSPGHRQNILKPEFTEAGVSYIFNPNSTYGGYFAIVFAQP
jgi:uncharacterized protein YkwD